MDSNGKCYVMAATASCFIGTVAALMLMTPTQSSTVYMPAATTIRSPTTSALRRAVVPTQGYSTRSQVAAPVGRRHTNVLDAMEQSMESAAAPTSEAPFQGGVFFAAVAVLWSGLAVFLWKQKAPRRELLPIYNHDIAIAFASGDRLQSPEPKNGVAMRASFLDSIFGGGDDSPKMGKWKPGTKKVLFCDVCKNKGAVTCPGCNGKGRSKKNGNIMERYKCMVCQGIGLVPCPECDRGGKGLTPEQKGER